MKTNNHVQLQGWAIIDEMIRLKTLKFEPAESTPDTVKPMKRRGLITQQSDGSFEVIVRSDRRANTKLIVKLPHGRLSLTNDGAYLLTLKVYKDDGENVKKVLLNDATVAAVTVGEMIEKHEL